MEETDRDPCLDTNFQQPPPSTTTTTTTYATVARKRGRPRKYNSPEEAAAAKKLLLAAKKQHISPSPPATANNSFLGNDGNGFTPYIINVTTGEGSFDIISLCGSYVHADRESRTGGLSICMSSNEGQIVGGGVGGPLIAAGLVQVIVGTFVISSKNTVIDAVKDDDASVRASVPDVGFPSVPDSTARHSVFGNDSNHQHNDLLRDVNYTQSRHEQGIGKAHSRSVYRE